MSLGQEPFEKGFRRFELGTLILWRPVGGVDGQDYEGSY